MGSLVMASDYFEARAMGKRVFALAGGGRGINLAAWRAARSFCAE